MRSWPSSSRSVAASRATASARRCAPSPSGSHSRSTRCRAGRRSSTGPCPTSGTSATPTSRGRTASASSTSAIEPPRRRLQRAGPGGDVARRAATAPARARRATRTGSRTARRTTRGRGASASRRSDLDALDGRRYQVVVDSTLEPGSLTYGECVLPGESRRRGAAHDTRLPPVARERQPLRYRCCSTELGRDAGRVAPAVHVPLPVHPRDDRLDHVARPQRGRDSTRSSPGSSSRAWVTRAPLTLQAQPPRRCTRSTGLPRTCVSRSSGARVLDFVPWGWDERQFNSPGFGLPVGSLCRSREGEYAEYHSSADDLDLVSAERLERGASRGARRSSTSSRTTGAT